MYQTDEVSDDVAAPVNCALATMVFALSDLGPLGEQFPRNSAYIQGAGLLGLYGCALLKEAGFKEVITSL